ncbi:ECF RNA polymerase sigma factor SigE [Aquisphaera giovannonii]|uniref:ECF RNA polymerase sigma factor SigE n=1 Tax=Aquisphaera giovannonii TaxID=406548 RepID=A0A5B9WAQ4_9BACT|nr:sigma-70 family RNA polymerase sigma factor [Aquisphaera giovannonii]QEH37593.1 ECF RNA polymerase sigma factor SigE [Aquisphaera giovannonii]
MTATSVSLLDRLKDARPDASDWGRLHAIYLPMITGWIRRVPGMVADAEDLAQEVFIVVVRELPVFQRRREGSFRCWLRQITVNKVRSHRKRKFRSPHALPDQAEAFLDSLSRPGSELAREWDLDHDRHVFQKLLSIIESDFQATTWEAFRGFAIEGRPASEVAAATGLSVSSVLQAKSRILKRLRDEAGELLA